MTHLTLLVPILVVCAIACVFGIFATVAEWLVARPIRREGARWEQMGRQGLAEMNERRADGREL